MFSGTVCNILRLAENRGVLKLGAVCHGRMTAHTLGSMPRQPTVQAMAVSNPFSFWTKHHPQANNALVSEDEVNQLMDTFPEIVKAFMTDEQIPLKSSPGLAKRLAESLQYNVTTGKKHRAYTMIAAYKMLAKPEELTEENVKLANIMAWIIEIVQACFLIQDDILDSNDTRRGSQAWHKKDDRGLAAAFDAVLAGWGGQAVVKKFFFKHPRFVQVSLYLANVAVKSVVGQRLDVVITGKGEPNLDNYTISNFENIAKYKTAYYSFQLPLFMAMFLADVCDEKSLALVDKFSTDLGIFYQIQNDYWDCFADQDLLGKTPEDIREGKCSWLAVKALERVNPSQRKIFEQHFGRENEESAKIVLDLYRELDLQNLYLAFEEETFNKLRQQIEQFPERLNHGLFYRVCEHIFGKQSNKAG